MIGRLPAAGQVPSATVQRRPKTAGRPPVEAIPFAVLFSALYAAAGVYIAIDLKFAIGDSISRVANAYYVLFSRTPHLGAIGFVWNPLPSLMELPLVALKGLWPPLATYGASAVFVSSVCAGVALYFLSKMLAKFGLPLGWRLAVLVVFAVNPMMAFYSLNGMTGMMLIPTLLASLDGVLDYLDGGPLRRLTAAAVWLGVGFMIRYEAIPFGIFVALGMIVGLLRQGKTRHEAAGAVLLFLSPLIYSAGLWLYANWLIMKNPLYFALGKYSNTVRTLRGIDTTASIRSVKHHLFGAMVFTAQFMLEFWPVAIGLLLLGWLLVKSRDARVPALIGATVSIPLLQVFLLYSGTSSAVPRYFMYFIPCGFVVLAFLGSKIPAKGAGRHMVAAVLSLVLVAGDAGTVYGLWKVPALGHETVGDFTQIAQGTPFTTYREAQPIVAYLNHHPKMTVLADSVDTYTEILRVRNPRQFIIPSDTDFRSILKNPRGRVTAFLVPKPGQALSYNNEVDNAWPRMWSGKVPWVRLVRSFQGQYQFRLYAVTASAP